MTERERFIQDSIGKPFHELLERTFPRTRPELVWHYTTEPGLGAILRSKVLHLTAQPPEGDDVGDRLEIAWGRRELIAVARSVALETPFSALTRMLDDERATVFGREQEAFVACFTTDGDQWSKRGEAACQAALLFDAAALNRHHRTRVEGHGLAAVHYGGEAICPPVADFLRAVRAALTPLGALEDTEERLAAQCLMDFDVLSFFAKAKSYEWEAEWRLVKRRWAAKVETDPRRVDLSIAESACGLGGIVLRSNTLPDVVERIRRFAGTLPYHVPVTTA